MIGNHLWNATRVQRFLRELGVRPTRWEENIAHMAEMGNMSVEEFLKTDPITYGIKIWGYRDQYGSPHQNVEKVLGVINYYQLLCKYGGTFLSTNDDALKAYSPHTLEEQVNLAKEDYERAAAEYEKCLNGEVDDESYASMSKAAYAEVTRTAKIFIDLEKKIDEAAKKVEPPTMMVMEDYEQEETKWECPTCTAVWRTKSKTD